MRELLKNKVFRTIFIYFIICLVLFGFKSCAKANVYYGNGSTTGSSQLSYSAYTTLNSGQKNFYFGTSRVYGDMTLVPTWFKITFCADNTVSNFHGDSSVDNVSFYLTDIKCNYPNSNYDKGRIMYLYGQIRLATACSVNGTNCVNTGKVIFNNDNWSSWVILNEEYKIDGINIDFGANQGGANSSTIINQNDTIINQNQQTNNKIDGVNSSITSSHVSGQGIHDKNDQFKNLIPTNGTITNVLLMPISLAGAYMTGISETCSSFHLGYFFGTHILLPCINMESFFGTELWVIIDVLFTGFMIYNMGKKLVVIFNDMTSLKDNQINELYGGGK